MNHIHFIILYSGMLMDIANSTFRKINMKFLQKFLKETPGLMIKKLMKNEQFISKKVKYQKLII